MTETICKTNNGDTFADAFRLMWYVCKECGHKERIWNSRDGVTPFGCGCPSCGGDLYHDNWGADTYAKNHKLVHGQRFWRNGTPDEAESIMRKRIESYRNDYPMTSEAETDLIAQCRSGECNEFQHGWPMLDAYDCLKEPV